MEYVLIVISAALLAAILHQRRSQRKSQERMRSMLEAARSGSFREELIDESLLSAVENEMRQFLKASLLNEENLQEQKAEIQTLISDISHQVNTPLSNIVLYSQLLEEELTEKSQQSKARIVRSQAEKLDFLLNALLKTSRLETGTIRIFTGPCDLREVLRSAAEQIEPKAKKKNIAVIFRPPAEAVRAMCDAKWTAEACFNLLDNAVKYTGEGGKIEISVESYPLFSRIDICDDGIGIAEEESHKIFGRFYRSAAAGSEEGVGLGLTLVREIAQAQSGYVKVRSEPGKGSCFSLFLPGVR